MNVEEILSGFEPAFRERLERKVFETTIEGFSSRWPLMIWVSPMYLHLSYITYYYAAHNGFWIGWILTGVLFVLSIVTIFFILHFCGRAGMSLRLKYAEDCRWSIAEFQRITKEFPSRRKKELLRQIEFNLKNAVAFMA